MGDLKRCSRCGEEKPVEEFYKNKARYDGLDVYCKKCKGVWNKEYNKNPRVKIATRIRTQNGRARNYGVNGEITVDQWEKLIEYYSPEGKCLCCDKQKELYIDHVIPLEEGGLNLIDNIQPLCNGCNIKKEKESTDYRSDGGEFARKLGEEYRKMG